jgi:solute carrier family 25 protein 38
MYFYALSAIRGELSQIPYFAVSQSSPSPSPSRSSAAIPPSASPSSSASTILSSPSPASSSKSRTSHTALVKLSSQGNLLAGAIARTSVGFVLNPITVVKARYEVCDPTPSRPPRPPTLGNTGKVSGESVPPRCHDLSLTPRQSSRYSEYHSVLSALRSLVRNNGVRGLFQGFTATAARDAPYAGLYLVFYEKLKELSSTSAGLDSVFFARDV